MEIRRDLNQENIELTQEQTAAFDFLKAHVGFFAAPFLDQEKFKGWVQCQSGTVKQDMVAITKLLLEAVELKETQQELKETPIYLKFARNHYIRKDPGRLEAFFKERCPNRLKFLDLDLLQLDQFCQSLTESEKALLDNAWKQEQEKNFLAYCHKELESNVDSIYEVVVRDPNFLNNPGNLTAVDLFLPSDENLPIGDRIERFVPAIPQGLSEEEYKREHINREETKKRLWNHLLRLEITHYILQLNHPPRPDEEDQQPKTFREVLNHIWEDRRDEANKEILNQWKELGLRNFEMAIVAKSEGLLYENERNIKKLLKENPILVYHLLKIRNQYLSVLEKFQNDFPNSPEDFQKHYRESYQKRPQQEEKEPEKTTLAQRMAATRQARIEECKRYDSEQIEKVKKDQEELIRTIIVKTEGYLKHLEFVFFQDHNDDDDRIDNSGLNSIYQNHYQGKNREAFLLDIYSGEIKQTHQKLRESKEKVKVYDPHLTVPRSNGNEFVLCSIHICADTKAKKIARKYHHALQIKKLLSEEGKEPLEKLENAKKFMSDNSQELLEARGFFGYWNWLMKKLGIKSKCFYKSALSEDLFTFFNDKEPKIREKKAPEMNDARIREYLQFKLTIEEESKIPKIPRNKLSNFAS